MVVIILDPLQPCLVNVLEQFSLLGEKEDTALACV